MGNTDWQNFLNQNRIDSESFLKRLLEFKEKLHQKKHKFMEGKTEIAFKKNENELVTQLQIEEHQNELLIQELESQKLEINILKDALFMRNQMIQKLDENISYLTISNSKMNEIIGNSEAIYQEKCKAFEFEAMERRADIEDLEKENKSLENQLEERNVSIQSVEQLRDWISVDKRLDIKGGYYEIFNPNKAGLCPFEYAFYRNYNGIWILESGEQIHPSYYRELPSNPNP